MSSATESGENTVALGPAVLLAVFIGLGVILFTFLLKWIKQEQSEKGTAKHDKPDKVKGSSADASGKHGKKEQAGAVKPSSKKKLTERETRRTARANDKGFNHPWLLATLKGHSGRVLDMDFSANGKYLVSCGDEDPDPGGVKRPMRSQTPRTSDSSSDSNKENSRPPSSTPSPVMTKGLSRRQRKNRKRDSHTPSSSSASSKTSSDKDANSEQTNNKVLVVVEPTNKSVGGGNKKSKIKKGGDDHLHQAAGGAWDVNKGARYVHRHSESRGRVRNFATGRDLQLQPLEEFKRMSMPEDMFVQILKEKYSLTKEAMAILGYPLRLEMGLHRKKFEFQRVHDQVHFYYNYYQTSQEQHSLDVHAEEFIPKNESGDSGNGSSSSSEEESSSGSEGVEESSNSVPKLAPGTIKWKDARTHICARCGSFFYTTSKKYITKDPCRYHPGKIETMNGAYGPMNHSCCRQPNGSPGCFSADLHVWAGPKEPIVNSSYVETDHPKHKRHSNNYGVYSLDCEMSYTVTGLEVVKVTLVDVSGRPVYNEFVKPVNEIVDFNTRFSGIVEEDFIKHPTKTLVQVQRDIKKFVSSETVLVGHGLENDLKGLKMIHKLVVDTAFTFPHFKGLPFKRSLKSLAQTCLNKEIQSSAKGHDSFEDARTCMELMLFRLRRDFPNNF